MTFDCPEKEGDCHSACSFENVGAEVPQAPLSAARSVSVRLTAVKIGKVGQNLGTLKAYIFVNMSQKSSKVDRLGFLYVSLQKYP